MKVILEPQYLQVTLKPGAWVEPAKMTRAIKDAGFTPVPEDVRFTLTGRLESRAGGIVLVLDRMTAPREIACVVAEDAGGSPDADVPGAPTLASEIGHAVEVTGKWRFGAAEVLVVETVVPLPAAP